MTSGEERVHDVGVVARQAQGALDDLQRGISRIKERVEDSALVSRAQEERMVGLAGKTADMARVSTTSANEADAAAAAMATQQRTIGDLKAVSAQLAELAERIRSSIAHFTVRPGDSPSEHPTHTPRGSNDPALRVWFFTPLSGHTHFRFKRDGRFGTSPGRAGSFDPRNHPGPTQR